MTTSHQPTYTVFVGRETELRQLGQALETVLGELQPKFALLEGDVGVGKSWLIHHFLAEAVKQHPEAVVVESGCAMETELAGLVPFSELLVAIAKQNLQQAPTGVDTQITLANRDSSRAILRQKLADYFSEEELRTLCFDMGLDYADLPAQGKVNKARDLVAHLERINRVPELIAKCRQLRPNVPWEATTEGVSGLPGQPPAEAVISFLRDVAPAWSDIVTAGIAGATAETTGGGTRLFGQSSFTQVHVFVQFTNALSKLSERHPFIVVIDDLHWADASSLSLLFHIARNLHDTPVLFICAYRPDEALQRGKNASLFGEIRANLILQGAAQIELVEGLNVSEYVASRYPSNNFPSRLLKDVQDKTGGHALFVKELFSLWQQKETIREVEDGHGRLAWELLTKGEVSYAIPVTLSEVLADRWYRIEEDFRKILNCASVEGEDFTAQVVASLTGADELATYESLEVLEQSYRLIQQKASIEIDSSVFDIFKFSHRFIREYIYSQLSAPHRRILHRQVGECLERLYTDHREISGQLVRHFREANEPFKCAEYALAAARFEQSRWAWSEGEQLCELGLKMTSRIRLEQTAKQLRLDLLEQSGYGFHECGEFTRSHERCNEALLVGRELSVDPKRIAELLDSLGDLCDYEGHLDQACVHYTEARQILEEHSIPFSEIHVSIDADLAYVLDRQGKTEEAIEAYRQILAAAERLPHTLPLRITQSWVHNYLGIALGNLGRYSESRLAYSRAIEMARETGRQRFEVTCALNLADDCLKAGLLDESMVLACAGLDTARKLGDLSNVSFAMSSRAAVLLARNNPEGALPIVKEAMSIAEQLGSLWDVPFMYAYLAQAHQMLGDLDTAYVEALRAVECGRQVSYQLELGCLLDVLAQIEAARADWEPAQHHFSEAIGLLERGGYRHMEARIKHHYARELNRREDHQKAIGLLQEAFAILNDLGLQEEATEVRALLGEVGAG
jgi:adenylate cyclase